ncbi:response regulator [Paraburkholderia sp. RL17-347-BIC-D]|uniref:XRE family transcriptional regulator n=1 Tax=Paraburkholderia sp. RL17-347-BIC-D TaxID=3031632 RepID=UPI0038BC8459
MKYTPPSPEELQHLKDELGFTSLQMAELFGLSSGRHWRSYTEQNNPRSIGAQTLFFGLSRLELDEATIARVLKRMRQAGAHVDLATDGEQGQ